jgi:hypothetical protein
LPTHPLLTDRGLSLFGGYTVEVWGNTSGCMTKNGVIRRRLPRSLRSDRRSDSTEKR